MGEKIVSYEPDKDNSEQRKTVNALAGVTLLLIGFSVIAVFIGPPFGGGVLIGNITAVVCFGWIAYFLWGTKTIEGAEKERFFAITGLLATGFGALLLSGSTYLPGEPASAILVALGALIFLVYATFLAFVTADAAENVESPIVESTMPEAVKNLTDGDGDDEDE